MPSIPVYEETSTHYFPGSHIYGVFRDKRCDEACFLIAPEQYPTACEPMCPKCEDYGYSEHCNNVLEERSIYVGKDLIYAIYYYLKHICNPPNHAQLEYFKDEEKVV